MTLDPTSEALVGDVPLNDSDYVPLHPPIDGRIPNVVKRWSPQSHVRWFARFWSAVSWRDAANYHCSSVQHKGPCCNSCLEDIEYDAAYRIEGCCCCRALAG